MQSTFGPSSEDWPPPTELIERCRDGEGQALHLVLVGGYPRLIAFFRGSGVDHADIDDMAAETCEGLVRNFHRLRNVEAFEAWFWAIARARLRTWIRKRRRPPRFEPVGAEPIPPPELLEIREEYGQLRAALEHLTPKDRELLWLREVEGLSYEEIGGRLRSAVGAVRVACHRARRRLEEAYGALEPTDG